jgi:membrane protein implicated in regulation of membrane protease activity
MSVVFLCCGLFGGTIFILQFVMAIIGAGAEDLDFAGDMPDDLDMPDLDDLTGDSHGSTWLFGVISFRTIIAALTFFGLAGLAAIEGGLSGPMSLLIAVGTGVAAMYGVHYLMQSMYNLRHDGTVRIDKTIGERGTVYIPIPAKNQGAGKIQIRTQGRIMEYAARTHSPERLKTGDTVEVTRVLSPRLLEVAPLEEPEVAAKPSASEPVVEP